MASSYMFDIPDEELYNGFTVAIHKYSYITHLTLRAVQFSCKNLFYAKCYFLFK